MPLQLPLIRSLKDYSRPTFRSDLASGFTTAVMMVPQAMAYAMLAGVEPIVGLYAATLPAIVYALFGTSRILTVGPVALVSLLVAAGVSPLAGDDPVRYATYASLLMLLVGSIELLCGIFRLGFVVKFLSKSMLVGFTSAAALIIAFSQVKHMLGVEHARSAYFFEMAAYAWAHLDRAHELTALIGALTVASLMGMKRFAPKFPRFLAVVVLGTAVTAWLRLDEIGVATVGHVPAGLPSWAWPALDFEIFEQLLPMACAIALVTFMECVAVTARYAPLYDHHIDPDQEFRALGIANLAGSFFHCFPVSGGFSRTAVAVQSGARTGVAALVAGTSIAVCLIWFTTLFYFLPNAVLAGIVINAVFSLIDFKEIQRIRKISASDFWLMSLTFAATLVFGIQVGIGVGILASLLFFVGATAQPHIAVLGRLPGTETYRNIARHPEAESTDGVLIVRVDAPLFFANCDFVTNRLLSHLRALETAPRAVILDAAAIGSVDVAGVDTLVALAETLDGEGVELWLATVRGPVRDALERVKMHALIPRERRVEHLHDAVMAIASTARESQ